MSKEDDRFYREFGAILAGIFVFFLIALFVARSIGANAFEAARLAPKEVENRIQPVGQIAFGEDGTMAEPEVEMEEVALAEPRTGDQVYNEACFICHGAGTNGAPTLGDPASWEPRVAQGLDMLINNAINGKDLMPAKGGRTDFSDEEVIAGLMYMLQEAGVSAD